MILFDEGNSNNMFFQTGKRDLFRLTKSESLWLEKLDSTKFSTSNIFVIDQEQSAAGTHKLLAIKSNPTPSEGAIAKHPIPVNALVYARVRHREADVTYRVLDPC